ncbi:MAG TPA: sigma-54 dependent transcriptional regulator, partial [Candidatus Polarisedimenticolia bacterium]|nr:sigma-54 dependent transcriptional regulator [Candidatus Polarisedimenticolia bacterium]
MNASVLVVDDEPVFRVLAEEALTSEGFEVRTAGTLKKARSEVDRATPDVVILDRRLPDGDGIDFIRAVRPDDTSATIVIVVTAYGDVENAVEALKAGAWDYLTKPVQITDLIVKLRKVIETRGLRDRLAIAKSSAAGPPMVEPKSRVMREVIERLTSVSRSPLTPVLMLGPSGVGKQRAAELLHALTWSETDPHAPFLEVNCAALPEDLVESELFGHEKGAFTDAKAMRRGLFEMAAGGTLFLDEITELPQRSQAKLLKFLDTMRFRRVGGEREIAVDLRVVAATNQDVQALVKAGRFREDLYHRLAVFLIPIPSLASRPEDIPDLAHAFVRFFAERVKRKVSGLSAGARAALTAYDYPGNVRELRNIIERAVILAHGPEVTERE